MANQSEFDFGVARMFADAQVVANFSARDKRRFQRLWRFRKKESEALQLPAFRVLSNTMIVSIADRAPGTMTDLESVQGMGDWRMEKFGRKILRVVAKED